MNSIIKITYERRSILVRGFFLLAFMMGLQFLNAQTVNQIEVAVANVDQMIKDHNTEFQDVLKMREAAGYQVNQTAIVKAVFLRTLRKELTERLHIVNALNATEQYCLNEKNFPVQIVTSVKNEIAQELQ